MDKTLTPSQPGRRYVPKELSRSQHTLWRDVVFSKSLIGSMRGEARSFPGSKIPFIERRLVDGSVCGVEDNLARLLQKQDSHTFRRGPTDLWPDFCTEFVQISLLLFLDQQISAQNWSVFHYFCTWPNRSLHIICLYFTSFVFGLIGTSQNTPTQYFIMDHYSKLGLVVEILFLLFTRPGHITLK